MRNSSFILDILHLIIGVIIVILAVLAFLNPEENRILFPLIFFLAALLNVANGCDKLRQNRGRSRQRTAGTALISVGAGLFFLCVLSAWTIWWG